MNVSVREALMSMTGFPIPVATINAIAGEASLDLDGDVAEACPRALNRAKARVCLYVAMMPNVSEGGVSISLTATDKKLWMAMAQKYAALAGASDIFAGVNYGYKGENL